MRNVSNECSRDDRNKHFIFNYIFLKLCRLCSNVKLWWNRKGRKWKSGGALRAGLVRLNARKHNPAPVHPRARTYTHKRRARKHGHELNHANAHALTHAQKYVILIAFPRQQRFRKHASALRHKSTAFLVKYYVPLLNISSSIFYF